MYSWTSPAPAWRSEFSTLATVTSDDRRIDPRDEPPAKKSAARSRPAPDNAAGPRPAKKKASPVRAKPVNQPLLAVAPVAGVMEIDVREAAHEFTAAPMDLHAPIQLPPILLQPDRDQPAPTQWVPTTLDEAIENPAGENVPEAWSAAQGARSTQVRATGRRPRPRVRRVTRVVRHVDPWSVFKIALCFSAVLYGICLTAGVLLWNVAYTTGTVDNLEKFFESFGWSSFTFKGGQVYHNAWIIGLFAALGLTGMALLAATLFNLITDLVGGIRVTVLEEEVVERTPGTARPLLRRRPTPTAPSGSEDSVDNPG